MKLQRFACFISVLVVATLLVATTSVSAYAQQKPDKRTNQRKAIGKERSNKTDKEPGKDQQAAPGGFGDGFNFPTPMAAGDDPSERLGLDRVMWDGPGVDAESLKGKSVLLFIYATWCPKCNAWSNELFQQMMMATKNRPVVILAINADEKDPTLRYVKERRFSAPNILHGYDPSMTRRFGYDSNLFRYVWIGPDGLVKEEGYMGGAKFADPEKRGGPKVFILAKKLHEAEDLGEFKVIQPDLPPEAAAMLWPLELGQPLDGSVLMKASRFLKGKLQNDFDSAITTYLEGQLEKIETLSKGDVADRLEAYAKAEPFAKQFRAFPQAKQVRKILDTFKKDRDFKKELSAMRLYGKATAKGLPEKRRVGMLRGLMKRFEGTYYATKAAGEIQ